MAHLTGIAGHQRGGGDQQQAFPFGLGQSSRRSKGSRCRGGSWSTVSPWAASITSSQREATLKHGQCCGTSRKSRSDVPRRAVRPWPRPGGACRAGASQPAGVGRGSRQALEQTGDVLRGNPSGDPGADLVEIVGHRALTRQQAEATPWPATASATSRDRWVLASCRLSWRTELMARGTSFNHSHWLNSPPADA